MTDEDDYRLIKSIMIRNVLTVDEDTNVYDAAKEMGKRNYSCVIVVENKKPIGILTERDFIKSVIIRKKDPTHLKIGDIMTRSIITIPPEAELVPAGELMKRKKVRRFPVIDEKGELMGLVTETDIMEGIIRLVKHLDWRLVSMKISVKEYIQKLRESKLI